MRFLPVFLDLQTGPIVVVGQGELVRAKLRLLLAAGARIRWYATDGNRDTAGLDAESLAHIEHVEGDPVTADLSGSSPCYAPVPVNSAARWLRAPKRAACPSM